MGCIPLFYIARLTMSVSVPVTMPYEELTGAAVPSRGHNLHKDIAMVGQFKIFISQQGQAISIAVLAFLFGGALLLGWL